MRWLLTGVIAAGWYLGSKRSLGFLRVLHDQGATVTPQAQTLLLRPIIGSTIVSLLALALVWLSAR